MSLILETVSGKRHIFLQRDAKILIRDSIYKLYINKVYLLLRDAKLLLSDSIYKLYMSTVYLFLRDAKHLLSRLQAVSFSSHLGRGVYASER